MGTYANSIRSVNATMEDIATLIEGTIGSSSNDAVSTAWTPTYAASGAMTFTGVSTDIAKYVVKGAEVTVFFRFTGTTGGTASTSITFTLPFTSANVAAGAQWLSAVYINQGTSAGGFVYVGNNTATANVIKEDTSNWGLGAGRIVLGSLTYLRA